MSAAGNPPRAPLSSLRSSSAPPSIIPCPWSQAILPPKWILLFVALLLSSLSVQVALLSKIQMLERRSRSFTPESLSGRIVSVGESGDGGRGDVDPQAIVLEDSAGMNVDAESGRVDPRAVLENAGIDVDAESLSRLPSADDIESMYGKGPLVLGLETCQAFRNAVRPEDRLVAPAGLFNTGTNLLSTVLRRNCYIPERRGALEDRWRSGMKFQVPWGKHNPVAWRLRNVAQQGGRDEDGTPYVQANVLPVVVVRDPITWSVSMCRHPYGVRLGGNCRNSMLLRMVDPVAVPYKPLNVTHYDSILHLWHDWYHDWLGADFPALFVRFEDILFHGEAMVKKVCDCAGGKTRDAFYIREESAKGEIGPHKGGSGLLDAIIKNGNRTKRMDSLRRDEDRVHIQSEVFADLLSKFGYSIP